MLIININIERKPILYSFANNQIGIETTNNLNKNFMVFNGTDIKKIESIKMIVPVNSEIYPFKIPRITVNIKPIITSTVPHPILLNIPKLTIF